MLVVEKRRHINVEITGEGADKVIEILKTKLPGLKVSDEDEYVNITDTDFWKETEKYETPGRALWTYRDNAGLTLTKLAEMTGIAKSHLSAMEHDKRSIGVATAKKLGSALKCDYRRFL
jgi:DNA-binding Xre family transcriptional regulator